MDGIRYHFLPCVSFEKRISHVFFMAWPCQRIEGDTLVSLYVVYERL